MSGKSKTSAELTSHRCPLGDSWQQSLRAIVVVSLSNPLASGKCGMQDSTCSDSRCSTWLGDMARIILAASSIGRIENFVIVTRVGDIYRPGERGLKEKKLKGSATMPDSLLFFSQQSFAEWYISSRSVRASRSCTSFRGEILNQYHSDWRWGVFERVRSRILFYFYRSCDSRRAIKSARKTTTDSIAHYPLCLSCSQRISSRHVTRIP